MHPSLMDLCKFSCSVFSWSLSFGTPLNWHSLPEGLFESAKMLFGMRPLIRSPNWLFRCRDVTCSRGVICRGMVCRTAGHSRIHLGLQTVRSLDFGKDLLVQRIKKLICHIALKEHLSGLCDVSCQNLVKTHTKAFKAIKTQMNHYCLCNSVGILQGMS